MIDTTQPKIRFEVFPRRTLLRGKRWFFRIVRNGNNEIISGSQSYANSQEALRTISLIRLNASDSSVTVLDPDTRAK